MGALEMGVSEDELRALVDAWRTSNPNIVRFWWDVDAAVKTAIRQRVRTCVNGICFEYKSGMLFIIPPLWQEPFLREAEDWGKQVRWGIRHL